MRLARSTLASEPQSLGERDKPGPGWPVLGLQGRGRGVCLRAPEQMGRLARSSCRLRFASRLEAQEERPNCGASSLGPSESHPPGLGQPGPFLPGPPHSCS